MHTPNENIHNFQDHVGPKSYVYLERDQVDKIYSVSTESYSTFMRYLANVAYEKIQGDFEGNFTDMDNDEQNRMLMVGIKRHFAELTANCYLEKGTLDTMSMVSYFDDFNHFAEQSVDTPYINIEDFRKLNLESYLEDAVTSMNRSTLDIFWLGRQYEQIEFERAVDASCILTLDFTHVLFENLCEMINEVIEDKVKDPEDLGEDELRTSIAYHLHEVFEELLIEASNRAINEFCNVIVDPGSKVMMKLMRYLEEGTYSYFLEGGENIWELVANSKKEGEVYNTIIEEFIDWVKMNQDIDSFTRKDIETLNVKNAMEEHMNEAFDTVQTHTQINSGMDPENRVVEIHARYMMIYAMYRVFAKIACDAMERYVSILREQLPQMDEESADDYHTRIAAMLQQQEQELMMYGIIEASHEIWDLYYPKEQFHVEFEDDDDDEQ